MLDHGLRTLELENTVGGGGRSPAVLIATIGLRWNSARFQNRGIPHFTSYKSLQISDVDIRIRSISSSCIRKMVGLNM